MTKLAVTTANTCVGVYADSEADKADGTAESGANGADALDADWDEQAQLAAFRPAHPNRPAPSRAHKVSSAPHKPTPSIPRAPALPRELRPPIAASRRDLTTGRPSSSKRSETRKRRLSPPKQPSQPAPAVAEAIGPTKPSPAASPSPTARPSTATRGSASIPPRPVSVAPRPTSKSVPPPAPSAQVEDKPSALSLKSLRPLPPSQRSKPSATEPSVDSAAASENEPIPLAKTRPAKPRQTSSETPSIAASYVASLGSSVPPTQPSPGTVGASVTAAAADREDHSRKEPSAVTRAAPAPDAPQDSVDQTRIAVPRPALALSAAPEPFDADADGEDTEVVDRDAILASRRQAQAASEVEPLSEPPEETLLPPSTPTAASGQAMEHIRREVSAVAPPPVADEHPPPATETDAPVALDLTPTQPPAPAEPDANLFLASLGSARGALSSPRARWAAGAGALVIGVAALVMVTSGSSEPGDAAAAATLPAAAAQVAEPQPNQPEVESVASPPAATEEPQAAEAPEPAPVAIRTVAVQVYPADAVIYSGGERLGKGTLEIRVPAGEHRVLLVKRDGYASRHVSVDGSASDANIALVKQGAVDAADDERVEEAEPEAAPATERAAPDPLAVSVPPRDDPYASVPGPEPEPAKTKRATPARDDPFAAVPAGKSAPGRWEENPGF